MAESPFGVNKTHAGIMLEFLRFARLRRGQCIKSVEMEFQNLIDSRLMEDTFTSEEVREMVTGLDALVRGDMESELIHTSHTHSLLVAQLLRQAEKWHLTMTADMSSLENKELLEALAEYEQLHFSTSPSMPPTKTTLAPLEQSGGEKLLQLEISRLKAENAKLQQRLQSVEAKVSSTLSERDELKRQLVATPTVTTPTPQHDDIIALQAQVMQLQQQISEQATPPLSVNTTLEEELEEKSKQLLEARAEVEKVTAELDKKFSDTAQYANMRKILTTKNDQIKELRTQLKKYES